MISVTKKTLEAWAESHSQSCRYYIKDALEKNYTKDELIKLYFANYVKVLNYISFDFKGEAIVLYHRLKNNYSPNSPIILYIGIEENSIIKDFLAQNLF